MVGVILNQKAHFSFSQIFRLFYLTFYSVWIKDFTKRLHTQQKLKTN